MNKLYKFNWFGKIVLIGWFGNAVGIINKFRMYV